jgi:hypothetical protein
MTDPEAAAQHPPAASVPAPWTAATGPDTLTGHDPAPAPAQAAVGPRRRRRWAVVTLVALVVAGLAAGLVVWAPWTPPPVLRPAGLVAGTGTANAIVFHWSRPRTGPLPDKYLILGNGTAAGSVAGTVTSYRQAGLTPATAYQYRVVAVRGGKRSPQSALLTVRTLTPPLSQARLQGSWNVHVKYVHRVFGRRTEMQFWRLSPTCAAGACDVMLHANADDYPFSMKLTRAGAVYRGQAVATFYRCGTAAKSIPDPTTLKIRIRVTAAVGEGQVWAATSLAGTMVGTDQYVASATYYCPASTFKTSLAGNPA